MKPLIKATSLKLNFGKHVVIDDVSLSLNRGEIVTVIGPNGAGKTSLIRVLLGLIRPQSGIVEKEDGVTVAYVPQRLEISEMLPLRVHDFMSLAGRNSKESIRLSLDEVKVKHLIEAPIQKISGGELQRVLIARALLKNPDVLILDEPARGVDVVGQQLLYSIIKSIRDTHECSVLMVSHDLHLVMAATDKVICLNSHICCTGHPDDVSNHPEYLKLFGGALEGLAVYSHHHDHVHTLHGDIVDAGGPCDHHGHSHDR